MSIKITPGTVYEKQHELKRLVKRYAWKKILLRTGHLLIVLISFASSLLIVSCNYRAKKVPDTATQNLDTAKGDTSAQMTKVKATNEHPTTSDTINEVFDENDIRLNGVLKRYFSLKEFRSVLGEPDSTKLLSDEEPCTNIFQESDGSVDPQAKYFYKNGSRFETSRGKVAIDEVSFSKGDHITYHGHTLNKNTTLDDLKKLFPNAVEHVGIMDVFGEGKLQVIELREDKDNVSDGHVNVLLKNGKLYLLHWWFPC